MAALAIHLLQFARRVLKDFFVRNNGLMLTSAVAYNALLSFVPLSAVLVLVLSRFFSEELLLGAVITEVGLIAPGAEEMLADLLNSFLRSRELAGWIGVVVLLFFGSLAFRVLQRALAKIFHQPLVPRRRKFWVKALLPYAFVVLVAAGLVVVTSLNAFFESTPGKIYFLGGANLAIREIATVVLRFSGWLGLTLLFTTLYKVMPATRISFRLSLYGGMTAATLWELLRYALTGYFMHISVVNAIYGSMATTVIVLLTMEAVALIVLLGAQVIADLQRSRQKGMPWWEDPEEETG